MADNVAITAGAGTTVATDDIAGVHHQRVKLSLGADGVAADAPGDGTDGLLVNLGTNNDVTVTSGTVGLVPATSGGLSVGNFTSGDTYTALTATAQVVKGSAGQVYGWYIYNPNTTVAYVMIYNIAAASVTVGTSTPILVIAVPAGGGTNISFEMGIPFATAISIAAATTGGGNTAPTTALEAMVFYK